MAKKQNTKPKPVSLRINNLRGRMLQLPGPPSKKKEILVVPGLGGSIERLMPLANLLNKHGTVTVADIPGIGGMSSFYSIGVKPHENNYASYLAAFIELRYHRKKHITIVTYGEGLLFVTKMLQNHAKAAAKVDKVISFGGILHGNDLSMPPTDKHLASLRFVFMQKCLFAWIYKRLYGKKHEFNGLPWRDDVKTYGFVKRRMLMTDACTKQVDKRLRLVSTSLPDGLDFEALKLHADIAYKYVTTFTPKLRLTIQHLYDEKIITKQLGSKLRSWL